MMNTTKPQTRVYKGELHKVFGIPIRDEWFYAFVIVFMSLAELAEANMRAKQERLCRHFSDYHVYIPEPIDNPSYFCIDGKLKRILK